MHDIFYAFQINLISIHVFLAQLRMLSTAYLNYCLLQNKTLAQIPLLILPELNPCHFLTSIDYLMLPTKSSCTENVVDIVSGNHLQREFL